MIIDCISDLHGYYPELEGGDLLIIAGDLTARDEFYQYQDFFQWLQKQRYRKIVLIGGNHDNLLKNLFRIPEEESNLNYLCDSGTEFEGLKIWGSPWTKTFKGMNPHCMAFTVDTEEELADKWALIPDDVDILITHSPAMHYGDRVVEGYHVGSSTLRKKIRQISIKSGLGLKLHVFGHIHNAYGIYNDGTVNHRVNASYVNELYEPVNKPIRVIL